MPDSHPSRSEARGGIAVISTDPAFREAVRAALEDSPKRHALCLELDLAFTDISDADLERLRREEPEIIVVDLESDPEVGLRFAQYLIESPLSAALVGAGRADSPDLLLGAMQSGISEFLPKPATPEAVRSAVERVLRKSGRVVEESRREPGRLLPVFSAKGGAGCTTVAANLAIEIHRITRKRTLLVDLDLELGESALLLGIEPRFSIVDLIRNFHRVDSDLLASFIERHSSGVELLSAPFQPTDYEAVSADRVRQVLGFLKAHYDYVVIDSPKTFNPATLVAFEEAEDLYLVTVADLPSLRNLTRSLPLLRNCGKQKPDSWLRLVVNRYDPKQLITLAEVERTVGMKTFHTLRNDYQAVMGSINAGKPVVLERGSSFAADIRELASKITGVRVTRKARGPLASLLGLFRPNGRRAPERKESKVTADE